MDEKFIEMNGGETIKIADLAILLYLCRLGDQYATLQDTVMNSDTALNEEYVLGRIEDLRQPREPADEVLRVHQKKGSRMKCFACRGFGH